MTPRLVIRPALDPKTGRQRASERGPLYDVGFEGVTLLEGTTQPFLDGCRELQAKGMSGPVEMWDKVRPYPRMTGRIEVAAGLTVREGDHAPRFSKWTPFVRPTEEDPSE